MIISVISKLFEGVLLNIANDLLISNDLQFGFKKYSGCANALYTFTSTVDYFNANGSSVLLHLTLTKHWMSLITSSFFLLWYILVSHGGSLIYLSTGILKLNVAVRWNNVLSYTFMVGSGIRQGSCLSPYLFNVFIICLLSTCVESVLVAMLNRC